MRRMKDEIQKAKLTEERDGIANGGPDG